ncbi:acyltransferase family protein [Heliobacterium gestii]|uniref:Acyltransferase family protein n=1 Tax=Heliomicrobium gestii TaxID=2699 RepID=A0A845LA95_HELGE|nr:acyltransferase [Heliomicrobium gestii]MBM7865187.1 surface polysaccharide O-acyltransferase-like enzyme [Heliomicrobium gestii]MZP41455.1 acyltransferase family protein [Heliomicrobium gestii]
MTKKSAIEEIQALRGVAFLGVALQHTLGAFIHRPDLTRGDAVAYAFLFTLAKLAVPAFVFITGMVVLYNYYDQLDYPRFLWRRIQEILIPYLAWTVFYSFYAGPPPESAVSWARDLARNLLTGDGSYHLWFVVMIFQFYLLYPIFRWGFRHIGERAARSSRGLVALMSLLGIGYLVLTWLSYSVIPNVGEPLALSKVWQLFSDYRDRTFLFWFFYFILGGAAGLAVSRWRQWTTQALWWNGALFAVLFLWVTRQLVAGITEGAEGVIMDVNVATSLRPSVALYSVSVIVLAYGLATRWRYSGDPLSRVMHLLGRHSYGLYLAHAFTLDLTARAIRPYVHNLTPLPAMTITFIGCVAGALTLTLLLGRMPRGEWLVGSKARRKPSAKAASTSGTANF